jgi:hypothetical protein
MLSSVLRSKRAIQINNDTRRATRNHSPPWSRGRAFAQIGARPRASFSRRRNGKEARCIARSVRRHFGQPTHITAALKAKAMPTLRLRGSRDHTDGRVTRQTLLVAVKWLWQGYPGE